LTVDSIQLKTRLRRHRKYTEQSRMMPCLRLITCDSTPDVGGFESLGMCVAASRPVRKRKAREVSPGR
jgi:hypothetical protein